MGASGSIRRTLPRRPFRANYAVAGAAGTPKPLRCATSATGGGRASVLPLLEFVRFDVQEPQQLRGIVHRFDNIVRTHLQRTVRMSAVMPIILDCGQPFVKYRRQTLDPYEFREPFVY